jgi:ABC-2 type transport system permease protein/sodium transport system permease protein
MSRLDISLGVPDRLSRLGRLTLKELREILRDRRTIATLVLMPLLLYPLLTIAFQQFFVSQIGIVQSSRYTIGFQDDRQGEYLVRLLELGGLTTTELNREPPRSGTAPGEVIVQRGVRPDLVLGLGEFDIHVGLRIAGDRLPPLDPNSDVAVDVDLLIREDWQESKEAAAYIEGHLRAASDRLLAARLGKLSISQRAVPVQVTTRKFKEHRPSPKVLSITAVIPFILILMTVTGAVYPAIDLTAGERERGTLEILVAAPIPRVGVLFAKYTAVLTVALLTAIANLVTMTVTLTASGLGQKLFGGGISPDVIAQVFGLLLLFAAFFSAVLLVITSCARSFKEAQAYLIPLILVALAPGMLSLMPGLQLSGLLLVTPLANIVLLGRDLFALKASGGAAFTVVVSTLVYAGAAIALAARIFGAESVLYSNQTGWADLFRRPREPQPAPSLTSAVVCLALMFPLYFLLLNLTGRYANIEHQLAVGVATTAIVFGFLPWLSSWLHRVSVAEMFRVSTRSTAGRLAIFAGALLAGLSVWTLDHELVVQIKDWRGIHLDARLLQFVQEYFQKLRELPATVVVLCMAVVPAVFEELFFRGYLFGALRAAMNAFWAIVVSAVVFGLFHAIMPNPLASERLVSSMLTGLFLGWVRWRTGGVLAGAVVHMCHNGLLIMLGYYEPQLRDWGVGVDDESHLPLSWLIRGSAAAFAGLSLIYLATTRSIKAEHAARPSAEIK